MNKVPHAAVSRGPRPQLGGNQRPGHGDTCVGAAVAGQQGEGGHRVARLQCFAVCIRQRWGGQAG